MPPRVDYDPLAPRYEARYQHNPLAGVARELQALARQAGARDALEVGCGTGRWLRELRGSVSRVCGLDNSVGMLRQARQQSAGLRVTGGEAAHLPFPTASFDLVFSVNASHHFADRPGYIGEARRVLRPGGALALIGLDPHIGRDRWYLYDYFVETRDLDLARFSSSGTLLNWMLAAGFQRAEWRVAENIRDTSLGAAVWETPFIQKGGTSQLALLSDEAYAAGCDRIRAAMAAAEARGESIEFTADLWLTLLVGWA